MEDGNFDSFKIMHLKKALNGRKCVENLYPLGSFLSSSIPCDDIKHVKLHFNWKHSDFASEIRRKEEKNWRLFIFVSWNWTSLNKEVDWHIFVNVNSYGTITESLLNGKFIRKSLQLFSVNFPQKARFIMSRSCNSKFRAKIK